MLSNVELAKKLIKFETLSPVTSEESLHFISEYLEEHGIDSNIHEFNDVLSLTASTGNKRPRICFNGHIDVVDPGSGWSVTDPFTPTIKRGKLYGRGASDMKGNLAGLINSFIQLHQDQKFESEIELMVVGDEEQGGFHGTAKLLQNNADFDYAIVGEPTTFDLKVGARGITWVTIKIHGESAHAATPEHVDSIVEKLPDVIDALASMEMTYDESDEFPAPTAPVTSIRTDDTQNKIPAEIQIKMDIRTAFGQSVETIREDLNDALNPLDVEYSMEIENHGDAHRLHDKEFRDIASHVIEDVSGERPEFIIKGGSSDGRFFAERGIPYIRFGVDEEPNHQIDEYCHVEYLEKVSEVYSKMARQLRDTKNL